MDSEWSFLKWALVCSGNITKHKRADMSESSQPRGTIFQSEAFTFPDLDGGMLEKLLGFVDEKGAVIVLFLKVTGHHWQRCFLDAGINFWGELSEESVLEELQNEPFIDFGRRLSVVGQHVGVVCADPTPRIRIPVSAGELILEAEDANVIDSQATLRFVSEPL